MTLARTVVETCVIIQLMSRMISRGALIACPADIASSGDLNFPIGPLKRVSRSSVFAKHVYSEWAQGVREQSFLSFVIRNEGKDKRGTHYEKTYDNIRRQRGNRPSQAPRVR